MHEGMSGIGAILSACMSSMHEPRAIINFIMIIAVLYWDEIYACNKKNIGGKSGRYTKRHQINKSTNCIPEKN